MRIKDLIGDDNFDELKPLRRRLTLIRWIFFCLFVTCIVRLYYVQIVQHDFWTNELRKMNTVKSSSLIKRGTILDRNGNNLAISTFVKSLYGIPPELSERVDEVSEKLSVILDMDIDKIKKKISPRNKTKFVWIKRALSSEEVEKIKKAKITGIAFKNEFIRVYPKGNLAAHLIGSVGLDKEGFIDNKGLCGIELSYNDVIKGGEVKEKLQKAYTGKEYKKDISTNQKNFGRNIHLTIDEVIQHILEQEAAAAYEEWNPDYAVIIVMDPKTGEILGLTNRPTYNNTKILPGDQAKMRNRAITDLYEPGSIFKIITFAAGFDYDAIKIDENFKCEGTISFVNGKYKMRCHGVVHGNQTAKEVFANSCNVCSIKIAQKIGAKKFSEFIEKMRFRESTSILPNISEPRGLLNKLKRWSTLSLPSLSIGQEIGITALQILRAGCSVLNAGILMKPMIIKSIVTPNGNMKNFLPEVEDRVMKADTAEKLVELMESVVTTGTGHGAGIKGYKIIGKTGTGQIANHKTGGYSEGIWSTSFMGFINEPDYKVGILVVLKNPKPKPGQTRDVSGGMVAAPVFKKVAKRILMYKQILPTNMRVNTVVRISDKKMDYRVPNLIGKSFTDISENFTKEINIVARGTGGLVVKQFPPPQKLMNKNEDLIIFLGNSNDLEANRLLKSEPFMRHFIGKSMRESVEMLNGLENKIYFEGSGNVSEQFPGAGTPLEKDVLIRLKFSSLKR